MTNTRRQLLSFGRSDGRSHENSREGHPEALSIWHQATAVFLVLAVLAANAVAILSLFGLLTIWQSAVVLFTVLVLAAGTIWTILTMPRLTSQRQHPPSGSQKSPKAVTPGE